MAFLTFRYRHSIAGIFKAFKPVSKEFNKKIEITPTFTDAPGLMVNPGENKSNLPLNFPSEYSLSLYAKNLGTPRDLAFDSSGTLLVSVPTTGKVFAIINGENKVVAEGLNKPHGIAFSGNNIYIAETDQVAVYEYDAIGKIASGKRKIIDLPTGAVHFTRSILIINNKIYVSTGSSCNVCEEKDPRRAAVWWSNLDGSDFKPYSTGLRNAVFMTVKPGTDEIWATNMGRDNLGDNLPPETVVVLKEAKHYGWPYCFGNKIPDPQMNAANSKFNCNMTEPPVIEFQAHSAPLGLAFLEKDLLVSYHGSWNRKEPTGYKVVKFINGKETDFLTGFYINGEVWGRPADIEVTENGNKIFISDDKSGVIYLLTRV